MNFSTGPLEFERLKDLLSRYLATDIAKEMLHAVEPSTNVSELDAEHSLTAEAMEYLRENRVPFTDIPFLIQVFEKIAVAGSALEIPEIEAIQSFLGLVEGLRLRWRADREKFPKLAGKAQGLPDLRDLSQHLGRAIHNGQVDDRYSPELARIRRGLEAARVRVTHKLEGMVRDPNYSTQLQDQLVTVRNGRFVIPVRSDQKRGMDGIIHGTSSSGATVFMEPLAVLELNNEIVRFQEQERYEVLRILAELSQRIQSSGEDLISASAICAELELTFGKARFGRDFDCTRPVFSPGQLMSLTRARHPLLEDNLRHEKRFVSPVSLDMDANRRVLVISGPNAGGKTVVLKTAGLIALMAQSGIPVPAEEATVPVFDSIVADIGDQQSLVNHLSTFSAHVLAIRSMLESVSSHSLVLLDEIGSSTEPGEGAALARAVLDEFRAIGCLGIATTHYNRLKMYAETTPGIANAAMEFNEVTLEPTYRLLHGLAGASSGLKIAERLQLPKTVLERAWSLLDSTEVEASLYVEELRRRISDLEGETKRLESERLAFDQWKQTELETLQRQHREEIARVERRLEQIVKEMSDKAARDLGVVQDEAVLKKYQRKLDTAKAHAVSQIRQEKEKVSGAASPSLRQPSSNEKPHLG
jgi:DNA mismatch repair protein MutS2